MTKKVLSKLVGASAFAMFLTVSFATTTHASEDTVDISVTDIMDDNVPNPLYNPVVPDAVDTGNYTVAGLPNDPTEEQVKAALDATGVSYTTYASPNSEAKMFINYNKFMYIYNPGTEKDEFFVTGNGITRKDVRQLYGGGITGSSFTFESEIPGKFLTLMFYQGSDFTKSSTTFHFSGL